MKPQRDRSNKMYVKKGFAFALTVFLSTGGTLTLARANGNVANDRLTAAMVRDWSQLALDMIAASFGFLSPPGVARALSILTTSEWNAMVPYTADATPVAVARFPETGTAADNVQRVRRARSEDTRKAISVAAFLALAEIFYDLDSNCAATRENAWPLMETDGVDMLRRYVDVVPSGLTEIPDVVNFLKSSTDTVIERAVESTMTFLTARRADGMNARGDLSDDGVCYSDYTLYQSVNDPQETVGRTNCMDEIRHLDKWQQLYVPTPGGGAQLRPWLSPYMDRVIPFSSETPLLWTNLPGPPREGQDLFMEQHSEVLDIYSSLSDRQKIIAEFWADGPASTLPPGHWHEIAIEVAEERELGGEDMLKLLFLQAQAVFDAGIASWQAKRYYDSARPVTVLQCLYADQTVTTWLGPYQGIGERSGSEWQPVRIQNGDLVATLR
ncbi:MAG: hypothetical protein F6J96_34460 [Symploca sp. SIO1C2]|nr:hypothetical protein [Symploca sp. SIO1C2]